MGRAHCTCARSGSLLALAVGLLVLPAAWSAEEATAIDIGSRNQVFIDGRFLQSSSRARIVVCPPVKTNERCIVGNIGGYSSLVEPSKDFPWYSALTKDGVHWRRVSGFGPPEPDDILGIVFSDTTIFVDPNAPDSERFKRIDGMRNRILCASDGSDWRTLHEGVFPPQACYPRGMDSHNVCFYDARIGKYVAYVRANKVYECPPERVEYFSRVGLHKLGAANRYALRTVGRAVTDDLSSFPMPEIVLEPDDQDPIFGGVRVMDFYCPQVVQYPYAQDAYFLFNCRYRSYEDWYLPVDMSAFPRGSVDGQPGIYNAGVEDIVLDASRDGIRWIRYDRRPWIPQEKPGSFDAQNMYMTRWMHLHGDEIWMYYIGLDDPHTGNREALEHYTLSRVVLRKDGFTCVEADYAGGEFTTPPLRFEGSELRLNLETSAIGLARVELQDENGEPIQGYALADCDRIHSANSTSHAVTWGGSSDVVSLQGRPVRLRFELQYGTKLYAFRFAADK
ncbi:MAG: hypothetical protein HPY44_21665 [Armatimonadetes bacterium]|nr:hypothetical protein [Armatimonadota bacterium]